MKYQRFHYFLSFGQFLYQSLQLPRNPINLILQCFFLKCSPFALGFGINHQFHYQTFFFLFLYFNIWFCKRIIEIVSCWILILCIWTLTFVVWILHKIKAIYNWKFVHRHVVASNWNARCGGYLDNFKILSILTLTFNCGFPCTLGLEKLRKMPRCNYVLIKLPNFVFIFVWRLTLFCPLRGDVYQKSTSGNPACSEPTVILRESNTAYHSKRP